MATKNKPTVNTNPLALVIATLCEEIIALQKRVAKLERRK